MLTDFITISFASFLTWQIIRSLVWFTIPARLAPLIVLTSSLLWALPFSHRYLLGFAATGGVAVINYLTKAEGIEPWSWQSLKEWMNKEYPKGQKEQKGTRKIYFPEP